MTKLTDLSVRNLPSGTYYDDRVPGFGIRVGKNRRTWIAVDTKTRSKRSLGHYPEISLADARRLAVLEDTGEAEQDNHSLQAAVERYFAQRTCELSPGTLREYKRHLEAILGLTGDVAGLTRPLLVAHFDRYREQSNKAHAARAVKTFLNWCVQRGYCDQNPMLGIKMPREPAARERVLSDEELCLVWQALERFDETPSQRRFQFLSKILITTGQRQNQISSLKPEWVDFANRTISFPAGIMKNRRPHVHYFGDLTEQYLRQLERFERFTAWPVFMTKLRGCVGIPHFTPHDWRRTYATISARYVPPHVTERILAHAQPEGPIASIYNRHKYEDELRDAARLIEKHITNTISGLKQV